MNNEVQFLKLADHALAYQHVRVPYSEKKLGVVFLSGYASDMTGTKASFLAERCAETQTPFLRFDYRGCGASDGKFLDNTIGSWLEDSLAALDQLTSGPQIIIGSSMGGWLGFLLAIQRPERVAGFIGVAAAPDFTEELIWKVISEEQRRKFIKDGFFIEEEVLQGQGVPFALKLIEEGRRHLVLDKSIPIACPVHLIQGLGDAEVPWTYPARIAEKIRHEQVIVTLVKGADHRLSRSEDLERLWAALLSMKAQVGQGNPF